MFPIQPQRERPYICSLPAEAGPCDAVFDRFFYNVRSGKCEQFVYGGCGGNSNNFETLEKCQRRCGAGN
uniref:BPTI/Kunitz inhibitor domain-containing protein n=1 Tax=Sphenodon punctatus TaxID=8508 RepID=A0A8D0H0G1_SPHPU